MNKREFIRTFGLGVIGLASSNFIVQSCSGKKQNYKNWAWMSNRKDKSNEEWIKMFATLKSHHIDAVLIYGDKKEDILPLISLANQEGVEIHHWIRSLECVDEEIINKHPEWFSVSRNGDSSLDKPPYIPQYKWLCPTKPEVQEYMVNRVTDLATTDGLAGVHLDYIRYVDVILPIGIQPRYNLVQDKEYPEFDFCYCSTCREAFKEQEGTDPLELADPSKSESWRKFRYDSLTNLVNQCCDAVHQKNKQITAAVFPSPEIARNLVRQDWTKWNMDAVLPMMYHKYYNEKVDWIKKVTEEGKKDLPAHIPLFSGLHIAMLEPDEIQAAINNALQGGADGIVLFTGWAMTDDHWENLKEVL